MAAFTLSSEASFPFQFRPQATQDADLLRQLDFVPGLKEILMLRQVHALEHATVWVLSQSEPASEPSSWNSLVEHDTLGGLSTEQGFYLYGCVHPATLRQAVSVALQRLLEGEWNLAIHPRCGTNLSVGMVVAASLALGAHFFLPKGPIEQLLGLGVATSAAACLTPELGHLAQRYITTAVPFNLEVDQIERQRDRNGRPVHFVRVRWIA